MMNDIQQRKYIEVLKQNELFNSLKPEELLELLKNFEVEKWPKHTCSLDSDKNLYRFYIIVSGRLKIYLTDPARTREFTLFLLTKNDVFDVLCLLDGRQHKVYYEALDDVELLSIPIENMRKYLKKYPAINGKMLPYLAKQLRALEEYASNITLIDISTRLAKLILKNINNSSRKLEFINDLSNEEIANLIGSTRAVVNRHLQEFKSSGILKIGRNRVEINNLDLLLKKIENKKN